MQNYIYFVVFVMTMVRPTSEKLLQQACSSLDCDLISLDLSVRHMYHFKPRILGLGITRGLKFEICYASSIHDLSARRNLVGSPRNKHKARPTAAGPFEFINGVIKGLNVPTFKIV